MVPDTVLVAAAAFSLVLVCSHLDTAYMDEEFHVPQLGRYLEGKYLEWDGKITTLPGMYALTWGLCRVTGLHWMLGLVHAARLYNALVAATTLLLLRKLTPVYSELVFLFPPLFATFSIYYTDPTALCLLLGHFLAIQKRKPVIAATVITT